MHIALAIDSNYSYLKQCFVMLFSLLYHNKTDPIILHILHTPETKQLFQDKREYISHFIGTTHVTLCRYEITRESIKKVWLPIYNGLTLTTYFRLLLPSLLDQTIDRCLYLDVDLIVRWSVSMLYETPMTDNDRVAGVMTNILTSYSDNLGIDRYINAGVILIHLTARRRYSVSQQIVDFIIQYPQWIKGTQSIMGDQCGINYICRDHLIVVDPLRNVTPFWFSSSWWPLDKQSVWYDDMQILQARYHPRILHFAGLHKPSDRICVHPRKYTYYRYLFYAWLVEVSDFCKFIVHILTYPRVSNGFLFYITKKLQSFVLPH